MKQGILFGFLTALIIFGGGCQPTTNIPYNPPPTTTNPAHTVASNTGALLSGTQYLEFHYSAQPGQTLVMTWATDSSLEGFIFSATQFSNFKPLGIPNGYMSYGSGNQKTLTFNVQYADTYYVVLANRIILASLVKVYEFSLVVR